ncbi:MAG: stage II sporulation protein P [Clostridia bacterium]|nr:stage II sporulation protein P [Clostridia bacterium]
MKKATLSLCLLLSLLLSAPALADDSAVFTVTDEAGGALFVIAGEVSVGDEYISRQNVLYRVTSVSGSTAAAEKIGEEPMPDVSWLDAGRAQAVFADAGGAVMAASKAAADKQKLIAMYVTHSDESYVPTDGTESIEGQGGIYDVARAFRDALQQKGVDVILDESTHLPHDAGAYRRSRRTAERLLQSRPDAIIDIHRDGIPDPDEYKATIDGKSASQVRLLVGRGNQTSAVNREFAKEIKAVADKKYPGLIKDIFIGKGNYNQDLSPNAILLEFGTHTLSKERVMASTGVMADVVSTTLYGNETASAKSAETAAAQAKAKNKGSMAGIGVIAVVVVVGVLLFALMQTGSIRGAGEKIGRNLREMTGGLVGKRKDKDTKS